METGRYRCLFRTIKFSEDLYFESCGLERCWAGKECVYDKRPGYHLHVVLSGEGVLRVNGVKETVHAGQMFLLKPDESVAYTADKDNPWMYCWITFDGAKSSHFAELSGFSDEVNVVNNNVRNEEYLSLIEKMLSHPEMNHSNDLMRIGLMTEFIARAIESFNKGRKNSKRYRDYSQESYVSYAVSLIESNYNSVKIDDIARAIGIHRSHLSAIFRKEMGVSPQEYLLAVRMKHATNLLKTTDLPIKEIAGMVGYDNPLTFSKTFNKMNGVGPREYRTRERK